MAGDRAAALASRLRLRRDLCWTGHSSAGRYGGVRILWLSAGYERVCDDCGQARRVPRAAAWRRGRTVTVADEGLGVTLQDSRAACARGTAGMGESARLRAEVAPVFAVSRTVGQLRSCPRCEAGRLSQQASAAAPGRRPIR